MVLCQFRTMHSCVTICISAFLPLFATLYPFVICGRGYPGMCVFRIYGVAVAFIIFLAKLCLCPCDSCIIVVLLRLVIILNSRARQTHYFVEHSNHFRIMLGT